MMIKHIVMWKLRNEAEGASKKENAARMKEMLIGLKGEIPELKEIEVGLSILDDGIDSHCDVVLTTAFDSKEEMMVYAGHPAHKKVVQFISNVVSERRVVDYEL